MDDRKRITNALLAIERTLWRHHTGSSELEQEFVNRLVEYYHSLSAQFREISGRRWKPNDFAKEYV